MGLRVTLYDADGPARSFSGFLAMKPHQPVAFSRKLNKRERYPKTNAINLKPEIYLHTHTYIYIVYIRICVYIYIYIVHKTHQFFWYPFVKNFRDADIIVLGRGIFPS